MACFHPRAAWRARVVNPATGKRPLVFDVTKGFADMPVTVCCGKCVGCLQEYARQWAVRCMNEAAEWPENCFITLTVADEWLGRQLGGDDYSLGGRPSYREVRHGELDPQALQLFFKRLRRWFPDKTIRYFACGEYGSRYGRPHYHALVFGLDFPDKKPWSVRGGYRVWRSAALESLWPYGNCELGSATFESASYVARYVVKKQQADYKAKVVEDVDMGSGEVVTRQAEFLRMSRRPGIGMGWLSKYVGEVYPSDTVAVRGKLVRPPRAYDKYAEERIPLFQRTLEEREVKRLEREADNTFERLQVREVVAKAKQNLTRGL